MALVNFKKGTSADYTQNQSSYQNMVYACEDTRDVYIFGVLQQGMTDELWNKLKDLNDSVLEIIESQKNIANGIAGLDEEGKIPVSLLNGQLAHVQGIDAVVTSTTLPDTTSLAVEYMVWCTDDKKLREWDGTQWDVIDPVGDTIYNFRNSDAAGDTGRTNILYRWDGTTMVEISASIALGETAGTAYEGSKGKALADAAATNPNTLVTGFGNVTPSATQIQIAFTDADKDTGNNQYSAGDGGNIIIPAATNTNAGLMSAADKAALETLSGDGEGSLADVSQKVTELEGKIGDTADLATDAKDNLVAAINEVNTNADAAKEAVDTLDAAAVKQVKVGTNEAVSPTEGLVTIANATADADGAMAKEDKAKVDKIVTNGNGAQFLANDGTYKDVPLQLSDDYAASELVNDALNPVGGDSFEIAIGKLHKAILDNEEVTTQAFVNFQNTLGVENPNMTMPDLSDTNYLKNQTQFVAALKALDAAMKTVADQAATITDLTSRVAALEEALTLKTVE